MSEVPRAVIAVLAIALAAQVALRLGAPAPRARAEDLPPAPSAAALQLAALGDPIALAKALMLYLQAFDYRSGSRVPYRELDYTRLRQWLARILELDPRGQYPLMAAAYLYAEVPIETKQREMLDLIYREFLRDPNRRWPWLAHAAILAKHRLHDLPLALRYADAIERYARAPDVPPWARDMRLFILEDMNELEAARITIGSEVASGAIRDPAELRFLDEHLKTLEARTAEQKASPSPRDAAAGDAP